VLAAKDDEPNAGVLFLKGTKEVGAVQVATGFAGAKEESE